MGVAVEGDPAALLLGGIYQGIHAPAHIQQVAVGDVGLHRPKGHHVPGGLLRGHVAVAADPVQRDLRKLPAEDGGVPVVVAQVDDHIRPEAAHRLRHQGGVGMGIGKNGSIHALDLFFVMLSAGGA